MTITYHKDLIQGTPEWHQQRCGMITASEVKLLLSPKTLKPLNNDKTRAHIWELAAQRISGYVEPTYIGDEMLRGHNDEIEARYLYDKHFAKITECGFITNDEFGFTLGCSPDALVGDDGGVECKSRRQKFQVQTFVEYLREGKIPEDFTLQVQSCLLITRRSWWDFISFSGGLPMMPITVEADKEVQEAIVEACKNAEHQIEEAIADWRQVVAKSKCIPTERKTEEEMVI